MQREAESGTSRRSLLAEPVSFSQSRESADASEAASADDPTTQVVQWVVDLRWQTTS